MEYKREALLYEKLEKNKVRCNLCYKRCILKEGQIGLCGVRKNEGGKLYTLIYGVVSSIALDPIEKKPLFHFHPKSLALSLGTWGCNFRCVHCQNWEISYEKLTDETLSMSKFISPEELIRIARRYNAHGIAFTYNEPTIWFEYTLDGSKLAKKNGLYAVYVTNGSITSEGLQLISQYLDAMSIDIKSFWESSFKKITGTKGINKVLERAIEAKEMGIHVEIVTNVIPGINDSTKEMEELALWIRDNLGKKTPWHITRFYPYLKLSHLPPTPVKTLEKIREIGEKVGLQFVYIGNVFGHPYENTYCPKCKSLVIRRLGYEISEYHVKNGKCEFCGENLNIRE